MEFRCGGEAGVQRPARPDQATAEEWAQYLFYRDNPRGRMQERWLHSFGCGRWFTVVRDTLTHEISESRPLPSAVQPDRQSGAREIPE